MIMKKKFICFLSFVAVFGLWSCSSDDLLNVDPVDTGKVTSVSIDKSFEKAQDLLNSFRPKVTRSEEMGQIDCLYDGFSKNNLCEYWWR